MKALKKITLQKLSILILILGFFTTIDFVNGQEGTKQFMPNNETTERLWLEFNQPTSNNFGMYGCTVNERINIHLNSGEKVYFGMKMNTTGYSSGLITSTSRVYFRVQKPSGTAAAPNLAFAETQISSLTTGSGLIESYEQAVTGPNNVKLNGTNISGGYNPKSFTADEPGDYYIEFRETSSDYSRFAIQYFDVTVTDAAGNVKTNPGQPNKSAGRLWSKK